MSIIRTILLILAGVTISACGVFSEVDENVVTIAQQLLKEQQNEHGDQQKVDVPLRINYSIHQKALVGHELEIEFEFAAERKIPILRLGMEPSDGLELVTYLKERYLDVEARQIIKKIIIVTPEEENLHYLNLFIVTEIGEIKRAKLIKIPIALGEYSLKKK